MAERVQAGFDGVDAAIERLNLLPREIERASRLTDFAMGDRARREARKSLAGAGLSRAGQLKRVQGRGRNIWIGADDINPIYLRGRLEARCGEVYLDGALLEGARLVGTPTGGYVLLYAEGRVAGRAVADFRGDADAAYEAALAMATDEDLYTAIFESHALRIVTGITKRTD